MSGMIKADLYRILKGKAIYVVFFVMILLSLVSAIGMAPGNIGISTSSSSNLDLNDSEFVQKLTNAKTLHDVREIMKENGPYALDKYVIGTNANLYYLFLVIVVIVLCTDFSNKSIKNTLSSAITRKKYYLSKLCLILALCTIIVCFNNYFFYFLNLWINGKMFSSGLLEITKLTFIQFPLIYGIISLLVCVGFWLGKTSNFNTLSIPLIMAIQCIILAITSLFKIKADWFYKYEFQFALGNLASDPSISYILQCVLLGLVYLVVFNIIGYYRFKRTEIK